MTASALHVRGAVIIDDVTVVPEVWVVGGRVTFTKPVTTQIDSVEGVVVPGYVDAHCHVGLDASGAVDAATARRQAESDRDAGTLLIRDAGSPSDTRWIDAAEDLPRVIRAGRHIARTKRYIRNYGHEVEPEALVALVRAEARRGDGWVKLVGDWLDREVGDLRPCWPRETLSEAIAAAHAEGARVTAHCFGEESLHDFAAAGTDCIEHATGLAPDSTAEFARRGIAIVPTLINIATFPRIVESARDRFPAYYAHMIDLHRRRHATIAEAHDAGVPIYVGTDAGGSLAHGLVADEAAELCRAGMSAPDVLAALTWGARRWLGRPGLQEGASADFVVLDTDPREDISSLGRPRHIVLRGVRR